MFRIDCCDKSLPEARAYWDCKPDSAEILAAIDYAVTVARLRGWGVDE